MKIIILSLLTLHSITQFQTCHGMLEQWTYTPHIQVHNATITKMRELLGDDSVPLSERIKLSPHIRIMNSLTADEKEYKCGYYAIKKSTGCTEPFSFVSGNPDNTTFNIHEFFIQTPMPKKNDVVVYTADTNDLAIKHFAIFIDNCTVESKWGSHKKKIYHRLFDVPIGYGNAAGFFTLKPEYKTETGKLLLRMRIQQANNYLMLRQQQQTLERLENVLQFILSHIDLPNKTAVHQ